MKLNKLLKILLKVEGADYLSDAITLGELEKISEHIKDADLHWRIKSFIRKELNRLSEKEIKIEEMIR